MAEHEIATSKKTAGSAAAGRFYIEGRILRDQAECQPGGPRLMAYVFDRAGTLLGSDALDDAGKYRVAVRLSKPADVSLLVGPADMPDQIRRSSAYQVDFAARDWVQEKERFFVRFDTTLAPEIWRPWFPWRLCVTGHVRKLEVRDGATDICPVPFVKVEVFDVDREFCLWPPLRNWWDSLLDRPVVRLPDLLRDPPFPPRPFPGPDPAPELVLEPLRGAQRMLPAMTSQQVRASLETEALSAAARGEVTRVGEARLMDSTIAARLDRLTVTSRIAPWLLFPRCFYSRALVCEATTDCDGFFSCCFNWWPFHFRNGRLRFDTRPDIIVRVTQVINGVATVIYMDPYTSTRWNQANAHIDLFLDDEEVQCGPGCHPQPVGTTVFFTRVGNDEVFNIEQAGGTFHGAGYSNVAYGGNLYLQAAMGTALTESADAHYYRLSVGPGTGPMAGPFKPLTTSLSDTRVDKATLTSHTHALGPQVVNGQAALYEVRNTADYYWYWPDLVGLWRTIEDVPDEGLYTVRLELFDKNGVKLTSAAVDYRDGTVAPPGPLPPMADRCDLVLQVDNVAPSLTLAVPAASTDCGVVKAVDAPFEIKPTATQENGRLHSWSLSYVKGLAGPQTVMISESGLAGLSPLPRPLAGTVITSAAFTTGLTTTCAFALVMNAWSHVRNGYGFVYHTSMTRAVAVENCPPCLT